MDKNDKKYGLGIYSVELILDQERKYFFQFDKFAFDETRYANAHIDYEEEVLHNSKIQRCYRLHGNKFSVDADSMHNGELMLDDDQEHFVAIFVKDFAGNTSTFAVMLKSKVSLSELNFPYAPSDASVISDLKGININTDDIHLRIPTGAVYEETWFTFSKSPGSSKAYSSLHKVGDKTIAVHNPYTIEIKALNIPAILQQKAVIVSQTDKGGLKYEGGEWKNGFVSANLRHFGEFEVMLDTTAPEIKVIELPLTTSHQSESGIVLELKDNLSGIDRYRATMDEKFFLLEYDAKSGRLTAELPEVKGGKKHNFSLSVNDKKGNRAGYSAVLIY